MRVVYQLYYLDVTQVTNDLEQCVYNSLEHDMSKILCQSMFFSVHNLCAALYLGFVIIISSVWANKCQ